MGHKKFCLSVQLPSVVETLEPGPEGHLISTEERIQQVQQKASESSPARQAEVSEDGELLPLTALL